MSETYGDMDNYWSFFQEIKIINGTFERFKDVTYFIESMKKIEQVKINFFGRDTPV